jgi:heme exporter protein A
MHIPAAYLSAGQKRRLGLARLSLVRRPVWLLDEPTTSLDAASVERLEGVIERHLASGGLVIAATHQVLRLSRQRRLQLGAAEGLA